MGYILGMSLMAAASLAVTLLAIVLVILTRPRPRPLLWAFWLSAVVLNVAIAGCHGTSSEVAAEP